MAADEKTIYDLVTEHFSLGKYFDPFKDSYKLPDYNYRVGIAADATNFINFSRGAELSHDTPPRDNSKFGDDVARHRLKFHVSIPEDNETLQKKAFDLLLPILMKHEITFKFLRKPLKMCDTPSQAGKIITIFTNNRLYKTLEEWADLITEITTTLVNNNIPPGHRVKLDIKGEPEKRINGCNYVTYRYEGVRVLKKWPNPDPVEGIKIDVKDQQEPKIYAQSSQENDILDPSKLKFGFGSST